MILRSGAMTVPNGYSPLPTAMRDNAIQRSIIALSIVSREPPDAGMLPAGARPDCSFDQLNADFTTVSETTRSSLIGNCFGCKPGWLMTVALQIRVMTAGSLITAN